MNLNDQLCIVCLDDDRRRSAEDFAATHDFMLLEGMDDAFPLQLCFDTDRIRLHDSTMRTSIDVDFISGTLAHRERYGGGKGQAIAKAIGLQKISSPKVLDVTAGLARDAYVLATLGCRMTLVERSPVLCLLIEDGMRRALESTSDHSVSNMTGPLNSDGVSHIRAVDEHDRPDVIYLDPMYPERKKSANVKKDMQILHRLIGQPGDECELLEAALSCAKRRVVVKRPASAEPLREKPSTEIRSKNTRYDVYITG